MLVDDLVRRVLEHAGHRVRHVVSITDLDDNTIEAAEREAKPVAELCAAHEAEFHQDSRDLGNLPAHVYARTSESVEQMIALARELVQKGFAYEKLRSVYFNIGRIPEYGELSGKDLGKIRIGATVDLERYDKNDPRDFTLLRRSTLGEIRKGVGYKTEWGNVRPSWHVQCSAMARAHLGDRFDLHMASTDLIFPHNENELAQGRALSGQSQARFWLHSELVLVGGKKMTYAEDTRVTLPDLESKGYTAREIRLFLLQTHYRQPIRLSDQALEAARASLRRIDDCVQRLRELGLAEQATPRQPAIAEIDGWIAEAKESFRRALYDDINVSAALGAVFRLIRLVNPLANQARLCPKDSRAILDTLSLMDQVLAVLPPTRAEDAAAVPIEVTRLLAEREQARQVHDFARADALRTEIAAHGYQVEDRAEGPRLRSSSS
jgi:cysteinyl-tRNA synthetase